MSEPIIRPLSDDERNRLLYTRGASWTGDSTNVYSSLSPLNVDDVKVVEYKVNDYWTIQVYIDKNVPDAELQSYTADDFWSGEKNLIKQYNVVEMFGSGPTLREEDYAPSISKSDETAPIVPPILPSPPTSNYGWVYGPSMEWRSGSPPSDYEQKNDGTWWPFAILNKTQTNNSNTTYTNPPSRVPFKQSPVSILVTVNVQAMPSPREIPLTVNLNVYPSINSYGTAKAVFPAKLETRPIKLKLQESLRQLIKTKLTGKIESFYDEDRAGKTLLNFGNDYQTIITNWKLDSSNRSKPGLAVKLYRPLPAEVETKTKLWVARELSPPVVDRAVVEFVEDAPTVLYLRPPNKNLSITNRSGYGVDNVTLESLFSSSSFDLIKPTDRVLEEWFTHDVNNTELNVDYSDYRNFIFYSSAERRIDAFVEKLKIIENLDSILATHSSSLTTGSGSITGSLVYTALQTLASQRIDTLRSFDGYERFLYYKSGIPYSSSLVTSDYQDEIFYLEDCTWPKIDGVNVPVANATQWILDIKELASEYDRYNQDRLANNIPGYLRDDSESTDFSRFIDMIGHQMDYVKLYIDQMSYIYDRNSDPSIGISQDVTWDVAESFGISLPNQYAIKNLVDYTVGESSAVTPITYRQVATETWKRFLHNQIAMLKAKGTKTSLRTLTNVYGVLPHTVQIRETTTPGYSYLTGSYEYYEEQTNGLVFNTGSHLTIPWTSASLTPQTLEFRFSTTQATSSVLINTPSNVWGVVLQAQDETLGQIQVRNASNVTVVSSSLFDMRNGDFYTVMLRNDASGVSLSVKRAENEDLADESFSSAAAGAISWATPARIFLGGSGSFNGLPDWTGVIDEVRVWGELLSSSIFDLHVRYPGMYNGNTTTSAKTSLYTRLSFNTAVNLGSTGHLMNESPYVTNGGSTAVKSIAASGFANLSAYPNNMTTYTREVLRYAPNAGGTQYSTNKVIIADPPKLRYMTFASSSEQVPVLSRTESIMSLVDKQKQQRSVNTVGFFFSLTDAINDNIIRSIGNIDLQNLVGDPQDQFKTTYPDLDAMNKLYWNTYAYSYNPNSFVDFVSNLLGPLFSQAREMIPVRAKLLSGIVHEPHILERSKVPARPVRMDAGVFGRREHENVNLEANPVPSSPTQTADVNDHDAYVDVNDIAELEATTNDKSVTLSMYDNMTLLAETFNPDAAIDTTQFTTVSSDYVDYAARIYQFNTNPIIDSALNYYDEMTNLISYKQELLLQFGVSSELELTAEELAEYNSRIRTFRSTNVISLPDDVLERAKRTANVYYENEPYLVNTINPLTNFDAIDSYTYFTNPEGLFATTEYEFVRRYETALTDRGAWDSTATYVRDDFVEAPNSVGVPMEWVCITTDISVISAIEPWQDTANWKQMQYISKEVVRIKKAVEIDGMVALVDTTSAYPPIVGYRDTHYRFTRDYRLGTIRHQWLGCLQTDDTTPDGRPVIEILPSAGDTLVVTNPGDQIQPTNNLSGPILDVQ